MAISRPLTGHSLTENHHPPMARFEVQIVTRKLQIIHDNAEAAYRWLDDHARQGERYQLNTIGPDGAVIPIEAGLYVARRSDSQGPGNAQPLLLSTRQGAARLA